MMIRSSSDYHQMKTKIDCVQGCTSKKLHTDCLTFHKLALAAMSVKDMQDQHKVRLTGNSGSSTDIALADVDDLLEIGHKCSPIMFPFSPNIVQVGVNWPARYLTYHHNHTPLSYPSHTSLNVPIRITLQLSAFICRFKPL